MGLYFKLVEAGPPVTGDMRRKPMIKYFPEDSLESGFKSLQPHFLS